LRGLKTKLKLELLTPVSPRLYDQREARRTPNVAMIEGSIVGAQSSAVLRDLAQSWRWLALEFMLERLRLPVYNLASRLRTMNVINTTTRIYHHRIASLLVLSLTWQRN
jgi:hypothetical protein